MYTINLDTLIAKISKLNIREDIPLAHLVASSQPPNQQLQVPQQPMELVQREKLIELNNEIPKDIESRN